MAADLFGAMTEAADQLVFVETLVNLLDGLKGDVNTYIKDVVGKVAPGISLSLILYVILWGFATMRGMIGEPIQDGLIRMIKLSIVIGLALNWTNFDIYISTFVWDFPEVLFKKITGVDTKTFLMFNQALTFLFLMGQAFFKAAVDTGINGVPNLMYFGMGVSSWGAALGMTAIVLSTLLIAKVALAILLIVGPIFICAILFESTRRLFDAWLGQLIKYMVTILLLATATIFILKLLEGAVAEMAVDAFIDTLSGVVGAGGGSTTPTPAKATGVIAIYTICTLLIKEVAGMAADLGRSISTNLLTGLPRK